MQTEISRISSYLQENTNVEIFNNIFALNLRAFQRSILDKILTEFYTN